MGRWSSLLFNLKTVHLITKSDWKTTIFPATVFALSCAFSGPLATTNSTPDLLSIFFRIPKVVLWVWLNLWVFNLANQRLPNSVLEDSINKPWRAIPSKRLTPDQARQLLILSIPVVFFATLRMGGWHPSVILMLLTWIYNDLGAADENVLVRHLNNALGFGCFSAGAAQVAAGFPHHGLNDTAYQWLAVISVVITVTIQFQDMEDVEGDSLRGRRTAPIVFGDRPTRWANAVTAIACSWGAPVFWRLDASGYVLPVSLGLLLAYRTLALRTLKADKTTFKLWCLWLMVLYLLPSFKNHNIFSQLSMGSPLALIA